VLTDYIHNNKQTAESMVKLYNYAMTQKYPSYKNCNKISDNKLLRYFKVCKETNKIPYFISINNSIELK
jgi:hypothetical protein